jgi:hypothetical protein
MFMTQHSQYKVLFHYGHDNMLMAVGALSNFSHKTKGRHTPIKYRMLNEEKHLLL